MIKSSHLTLPTVGIVFLLFGASGRGCGGMSRRSLGRGGVWLLASVLYAGLLTLSGLPALAQGAPSVTTGCCAEYCCGSAQLAGQVNPNGLTTTVYFQYGPNEDFGYVTPNQTFTGNSLQNVYAWINFTGGITEYYRLV